MCHFTIVTNLIREYPNKREQADEMLMINEVKLCEVGGVVLLFFLIFSHKICVLS